MDQQIMERNAQRRTALRPHTSAAAERAGGAGLSAGLLGAAFVLLWSTGYPAARIALDHSGPFTLLELRFGAAGLVFAAIAALSGIAWPRGRAALHSAGVGVLQLGVQFGALYWAASQGVNVGLIALVIGTMPIVTALLGHLLFGDALLGRQWIGFALGFSGVALAVGARIAPGRGGGVAPYLAVLAGLLALSFGTLYQKRHASNVDPRSGLALQQLAAAIALLPFAAHEGFHLEASPALFVSLGWVIGVNSLAAFALFFVLLKRGMVNQVAALFFLMPPVTALLDYLTLGDALTLYQVAGLGLSALGVYLATRAAAPAPEESSPPARLSQDFGASGKPARLRDGREVIIRPVRPADRDALKRFFMALSPASSRLRFHASMKEIPERLLREFTHPDQRQHVGLIAEARARSSADSALLVAEARFIRRADSDAAEFALVVADGWRRVGLGSSLMRMLLQRAGASGVRRLCGDALPDNETIRRFLRSLGGSPSGRVERDDIVRVCLETEERHGTPVISASR